MGRSHTAGPWFADEAGTDWVIGNNDGEMVAFLAAEETTDTEAREGNARLIAAAPDLLRCVVGLLPLVRDLDDCGPPNEGWQSEDLLGLIHAAEAAVAKATTAAPASAVGMEPSPSTAE